MRYFATEISKNFRAHFPEHPSWGGAMAPRLDPTYRRTGASRLVRAFGPSVVRLYVPEWRNQKLATLTNKGITLTVFYLAKTGILNANNQHVFL